MNSTKSIKAVIFDLDDLLVVTTDANRRAYFRACKAAGFPFDEVAFFDSAGLSFKEFIPKISGAKKQSDVEKIHALKAAFYEEELVHAEPVQPMVDLVFALKGRLRLCVATGASKSCADAVLKRFKLSSCFDFVVTRQDVDAGKPEPALFLEAARRFGLDPSECLVVEDSEPGVRAAEAAAMPCLRLVGFGKEE